MDVFPYKLSLTPSQYCLYKGGIQKLDRVNCADSAFIIFELLYNCFKNTPHVFFCYFVVCSVFVYLCTCIFVFACLTNGNIICDILE